MKLFLLPLALAGLGAGWFGLGSSGGGCPLGDCPMGDCPVDGGRVTVECTDHETCLVTCFDDAGAVVCQKELACDEVCDRACERPCEDGAGASECRAASKSCAVTPSCAR